MADYTFLPELRREVEVPKDGILSRTVFSSDRVKAVMFGFDTGQELSEHTAGTPAIIEVLDGDADILLGTDRHQVGPGAWIHMAAGTRHAIRATSPLTMLLILLRDPAAAAEAED